MKKLFFLAILLCNIAFAQQTLDTITLNLLQPLNPEEFIYNADSVWNGTYSEDYPTIDFEHFSLFHLMSGESYGGFSWEGFTISKNAKNTVSSSNWQGNMASGGILLDNNGYVVKNNNNVQTSAEVPYIVAYWSWYQDMLAGNENGDIEPSLKVVLTDNDLPYQALGFYVNMSPYSVNDIINGGSFSRAFAEGDSLTLFIYGLDENYKTIDADVVVYNLAIYKNGKLSMADVWQWVDLSALGNVYGLRFKMESTDGGAYGSNTATYFCMSHLQMGKVSDESKNNDKINDVAPQITSVFPNPCNDVLNIASAYKGQIYLYDILGNRVEIGNDVITIDMSIYPNGTYILDIGGKHVKVVKW
ncbi:hypothetical protein FACS1894153_3180 [Bacteroidia bacterium]|nr:hypothetical protein FACS1894153_3180 [Bacteroidia bacterium]